MNSEDKYINDLKVLKDIKPQNLAEKIAKDLLTSETYEQLHLIWEMDYRLKANTAPEYSDDWTDDTKESLIEDAQKEYEEILKLKSRIQILSEYYKENEEIAKAYTNFTLILMKFADDTK